MWNIIHPSFQSGKHLKMGQFCIIEEGVEVGDNVEIGNYVLLKKGTLIGNGTFIDSYVRSSGDNKIGDNCTIRYGVTIAKKVLVLNAVFISPNVMTMYTDHKHKARGAGTIISSGAFIGTAAILHPSIRIGPDVVIGAMSNVTKDCLMLGIYVGNPARKIK